MPFASLTLPANWNWLFLTKLAVNNTLNIQIINNSANFKQWNLKFKATTYIINIEVQVGEWWVQLRQTQTEEGCENGSFYW